MFIQLTIHSSLVYMLGLMHEIEHTEDDDDDDDKERRKKHDYESSAI